MTDLTKLFADIDARAPAEPPLPPGYLEASLARARRSARRRRAGRIAVAALAVLAVVVTVPWPARLFDAAPSAPSAPAWPTLPVEFPAFTDLTASALTSPPGRAIALYEIGSSELFTSWQTLVAGADRDTYRRVDGPTDGERHVMLAPDGTRVLTFEYPDRFALLDLTTGVRTTTGTVPWTSNVGASPQLLSWSPDGQRVAYAVPAPPPGDGRAASSFFAGRPVMDLALLDLRDGSTTRVSDSSPVWSASYSPDGRTLVVQRGSGRNFLATADGGRIRDFDLTGALDLAPGMAFSPDGALLATVAPPGEGGGGIRFVDGTGAGRPVPDPLPYNEFVGWRSADSVVVHTWRDDLDAYVLAEVSIRDGTATVLSRFKRRQTCEFGLHTCDSYRIQLASGLLTHAGIRPSDPDHGPWPRRVWVWGTVIAVETAGVALWLGLALRRRANRR
jgi:WD40 repeat protein